MTSSSTPFLDNEKSLFGAEFYDADTIGDAPPLFGADGVVDPNRAPSDGLFPALSAADLFDATSSDSTAMFDDSTDSFTDHSAASSSLSSIVDSLKRHAPPTEPVGSPVSLGVEQPPTLTTPPASASASSSPPATPKRKAKKLTPKTTKTAYKPRTTGRVTRSKRTRAARQESPPPLAAPLQASLDASGYRPKPSKRARMAKAAIGASGSGDSELSPAEMIDRAEATAAAIARLPVATESTPAGVPRNVLLALTSDALDEWQRRLAQVRTLTADDRRELQRQRRLIKNRESAQLSRLRKKGYIGQLEQQLTSLSATNERLIAENTDLKKENEELKSEIAAVHAAVIADPRLGQLLREQGIGLQEAATEAAKAASNFGSTSARSFRSTAATLLLVLFSFGALFNGVLTPAQLAETSRGPTSLVPVNTGRALMAAAANTAVELDLDSPTAASASSSMQVDADSVGGNRSLDEYAWLSSSEGDVVADVPARGIPASSTTRRADERLRELRAAVATRFNRPVPSLEGLLDLFSPDGGPAPLPASPRKLTVGAVKLKHNETTDTALDPSAPPSASRSVVAWSARNVHSGPVPNATYFYMPQLRSLRRGADPNLLGLMIPASAFSEPDLDPARGAGGAGSYDDMPVLEILCEVKSVMRTPFFASAFESPNI